MPAAGLNTWLMELRHRSLLTKGKKQSQTIVNLSLGIENRQKKKTDPYDLGHLVFTALDAEEWSSRLLVASPLGRQKTKKTQ